MTPQVDRTIAVFASLPFVYLVYHRFRTFGFDLPRMAFAIAIFILVASMVVRRPPARVTPNPLYWALAFLATYWSFLTVSITSQGRPLLPNRATDAIAILSLAVTVWARLSLGRNIGFVPAQREIVIHGAYRWMRHPIYTGLFIGIIGSALRSYSPGNLLLFATAILLFVVKSFVEEGFLRSDPEYAAYLERVRWRWFPGIA
jgi:protein-S-isoprenylcysteine O-methyltransferase Ste14